MLSIVYLFINKSAIISNAIILSLIISSFFHILWLRFPKIAKIYLIFIHTPLHYIKTFKNGVIIGKISLAAITTIFTYYILKNNVDLIIKDRYNELWWLSPVLGHIILDEIIMLK